MAETTHLNDTIGTIPPQARGCSDLRTAQEMGKAGNTSIYEKALDKSRCYTPDQIRYADGEPVSQAVPVLSQETPPPAKESAVRESSFSWKKAQQLVTLTPGERPFLLALIGILTLFIIIKLAKKK